MKQATLRVIFLTVFIDLLGFGLIVPILPIYIKELGASNIQVGIIAAVYSLMNFLFTPFFGSYSDRFGRRPLLLITIAINVVAYLLFGFAQTLPLLILSRMLSGIGSSNISVAQAYISDISTSENRAKSMGMIGAAFGLGFVFGPLFGALLSEKLGVGGIGFTAAGLCAINFIWAYFSLPESLKTKNKVAPIQFIPIQDYQMALQRPIIRELFLLNLVYITAFSMMHINSPLLWREHYGLEKKQILYVFAFIGIVTAFVQGGLVGLMVKKFGEQRLLVYGCFFMMIGLFLMPIVPKYLFAQGIIISMTCIALGAGCLQPSMASITSQQIPPDEQGRMLGLSQSFGSIARVIGPFIGGFLYDFAYWMPFIGGSVMMIGGVFLVQQVLLQIQKK